MNKEQLIKWLDSTNQKEEGIDREERERRKKLRDAVIKKAKTSANALRVGRCRGHLGKDLCARMGAAIKKVEKK